MPPEQDENFTQNLKALKQSGQTETAQWLESEPLSQSVVSFQAQDGSIGLIVDGQTQDSRYAPQKQAKALVDKRADGSAVWLFGLGSPQTLTAALEKFGHLTAFEPNPAVARAALTVLNLQDPIAKGQLKILAPFSLPGIRSPLSSILITHPASQRRETAAYHGLCRFLKGPKALTLDDCGCARILIVPPFSGGSLAMGGYLEKASLALGNPVRLITWPSSLAGLANDLKQSSAGSAQTIFRQAAEFVAEQALAFKAGLILCLAQAPLEASGVELISERTGAMTAFWFVEDYKRFGYAKEVAPAYDLFFHIQGGLLNESLKNWGVNRAWYLPLAADPNIFIPRSVPEAYRAVLSFLGALYPNRSKLLVEIAKFWKKIGGKTEDFKIFGPGFDLCPEEIKPHLFQRGRRVEPQECPLIYAGSQINLNIHSADGEGFDPTSAFVNPRTFEAAASEGFQIVDQRPLMEGLFSSGELCLVRDPLEMLAAIEQYLKEPDMRQTLAQAARKRVLKEHLYTHRLSFILECAALPAEP
jgi:spore maturation protein CgeB